LHPQNESFNNCIVNKSRPTYELINTSPFAALDPAPSDQATMAGVFVLAKMIQDRVRSTQMTMSNDPIIALYAPTHAVEGVVVYILQCTPSRTLRQAQWQRDSAARILLAKTTKSKRDWTRRQSELSHARCLLWRLAGRLIKVNACARFN
jgi:hypothetical protein